ncbi:MULTISPECIES: ABC transporter permease [Methylobacterium]|jgi:simple sugar transport system permease protein|uniref:Sugar ABC transporter permease n=2 Tax=Methylobacterium TaxID=407 RepID=A0A0C6FZN4_9HYPH|nr:MULTISPECIES: ABC transporter permease [Methylobacterium]MBK3397341.1 ABC transporter permease [Methylobacterium ajmalii]MBK3412700.1 ABC transporter permease [Methylobacterium ajmalii]MBK3425119.1 ABC transporter permease [Methylobacterium ajmalii]MBZ6416327.1 ABC transporter permease [Methylobacterium sp.]SFF35870.1 simple sugar transport system permease protein [Methylobacterium sp. yr596]
MRNATRGGRAPQELWLGLVVLGMVVVLTALRPNFLSVQNVLEMLNATAFNGILVSGLLVVLIAGGIDISFAAVASVAQYAALTVANASGAGWGEIVAIAGGIGLALGLVNGFLVSTLGIASIIVTIATQSVIYGILLTVTRGQDIFTLPAWFGDPVDLFVTTDAKGNVYAISLQIWALVLAFASAWFLLNRTHFGRQVFALGGNPEAARRVGFGTTRLNLLVYGYMGLVAGLASLVQAQYTQSVSPTALVGRELEVVAAAVLGGASLDGGHGSVLGAILGLALVVIMKNGLALLGVSSYWTDFFTGLVIVAAVAGMAARARRRWHDSPGLA